MSAKIFDDPLKRKQCFEEFLQNKFKKEPSEVSKEEMLSLGCKDLYNKEIRKTTIGSVGSLYDWHIKQNSGQNLIFSILQDLGYSKSLDISEQEAVSASLIRAAKARDIFSNPANRRICFDEFLKNKFKKEPTEVTKDEMLSLSHKDLNNKKINKTLVGSVSSLGGWHADQKSGQNLIFSILQDTGYAQSLGIREHEAISAGLMHIGESRDIFSKQANRRICFDEFLKNVFKKEPSEVTQAEILSIVRKDFENNKINKTSVGSAVTLYNWYKKQKSGQNIRFYILQDTRYTHKFNLSEQEVISTSRSKLVQNLRTCNSIVILDPKIVGGENHSNHVLPDTFILSTKSQPQQIQITMSLKPSDISHTEGPSDLPLFNQALNKIYPNVEIITESTAYNKLQNGIVGEQMLIKSKYALDDIYVKGLALMGYQINEQDITIKTGNPETDRHFIGKSATLIIRAENKNDAAPLMFKNHLEPVKETLHILSQYSRMAREAPTENEMFHLITKALDWMIFVSEQGYVSKERLEPLQNEFLSRLARAESNKLASLGHLRYDLASVISSKKEFEKSVNPLEKKFEKRVQNAKMRQGQIGQMLR